MDSPRDAVVTNGQARRPHGRRRLAGGARIDWLRWLLTAVALGASGAQYVKAASAVPAPGDQRWEFQAGGAVKSCPAIGDDGTVYISGDDGKVYALDGLTGVKHWESLIGGVLSSPVVGDNDLIYAVSTNGGVYALDAFTGKQQWLRGSNHSFVRYID